MDVPAATAPRTAYDPGTRVEVWCPSLDRWVEGFEAIDVAPQGWSVRRISDGQAIPERFDIDCVRVLGQH